MKLCAKLGLVSNIRGIETKGLREQEKRESLKLWLESWCDYLHVQLVMLVRRQKWRDLMVRKLVLRWEFKCCSISVCEQRDLEEKQESKSKEHGTKNRD